MKSLNNSILFLTIALWTTSSAFAPASTEGDQAIRIAVTEVKTVNILDAYVVGVSHSVKASISFYEVTKPFAELDENIAAMFCGRK